MNRFSLLAALLLAVSAALHADDWSVRPINGVPRLTRNGEAESNFIFSAFGDDFFCLQLVCATKRACEITVHLRSLTHSI